MTRFLSCHHAMVTTFKAVRALVSVSALLPANALGSQYFPASRTMGHKFPIDNNPPDCDI